MVALNFKQIYSKFNANNYIFDSGNAELNNFFYSLSKKFIEQNFAQVYLLEEGTSSQIIGYYAITCCNIQYPQTKIPVEKIARYIPGALIGMLAIDKKYQRKGYGSDLLRKIIEICLDISKKIGCRCLIADALTNLNSINFYLKYGFEFVVEHLGEKIVNDLKNNVGVQNPSVKMYFDLFKIQRKIIFS
jgi:GNAT superfamily N-acetyltransferase